MFTSHTIVAGLYVAKGIYEQTIYNVTNLLIICEHS